MDAQEMHDLEMEQRAQKRKLEAGSKSRLKALLREKSGSSSEPEPNSGSDPIEMALLNNPGLTREKAEEMAEKLGF